MIAKTPYASVGAGEICGGSHRYMLLAGCGSSGSGSIGTPGTNSNASSTALGFSVPSAPDSPSASISVDPANIPSDSPVTEAPTAASTTDPAAVALGAQYVGWWTGGGRDVVSSFEADSTAIATAAQAVDENALSTGCVDVQLDVVKAQQYAPVPESATQTEWSAALTSYSNAATDCTAGITAQGSSLVLKAGDELTAGTAAVQMVAQRIKAIGDGLG